MNVPGRSEEATLPEGVFFRAVLDSLSEHVAVLDAEGRIVVTNRGWEEFAAEIGGRPEAVGRGANYLRVCEKAAEEGSQDATRVAEAIRRVTVGQDGNVTWEYPCHSPAGSRWFRCRVNSFSVDGRRYVVVAHENITAEKQLREEFDRTRLTYAELDRVAPVGILFADAAGRCTHVNQTCSRLSGLPVERMLDLGFLQAVAEADRPRVTEEWQAMVRAPRLLLTDFRVARPDGSMAWVRGQATPVENEAGVILGFIRVLMDVTRQTLAESALRFFTLEAAGLRGETWIRATLRKLASLIECEMVAHCPACHDPSAICQVLVAGKWLEVRGSELSAGGLGDEIRRSGAVHVACGAQRRFPGNPFLLAQEVESLYCVRYATDRPGHDGCLGIFGRQGGQRYEAIEQVCTLFAAAFSAETRREAMERQMTALFEHSPNALLIVDRQGEIVRANRQVTEVFGWAAEELEGRPLDVLIPAAYRAQHAVQHGEYFHAPTFRRMGIRPPGEVRGLRKDGSEVVIDVAVSPIPLPGETLVAAAVMDLTERVQQDRQREQLQAQLIEASRLAGMADLATGVLHNIGNVLNSVNVSASLIVRELESGPLESLKKLAALLDEHRANLEMFFRDDARAARIPTFLVHVCSAFEAQQTLIRREFQGIRENIEHIKGVVSAQQSIAKVAGVSMEIALPEFLQQACQLARSAWGGGEGLVEMVVPEGIAPLISDKVKILQILVNLLKNARDSVLQQQPAEPKITFSVAEEPGWVIFTVADNGVGIDSSRLTQIFQFGHSTKPSGHGFGLHHSANAATELGGSLQAESGGVGKGATFRLRVPRPDLGGTT